MAKYKVTHNFVIGDEAYELGDEVELSAKRAKEINAKGQVSHPEISPLLLQIEEPKAVK